MNLSKDKETDKILKKYIKITSFAFMIFSIVLSLLLCDGFNMIPALLFSLICAPCVGALNGIVFFMAIDIIKN